MDLGREMMKIGRLGRGGTLPAPAIVAARIQKSVLLKDWPLWASARIRLQTRIATRNRSYRPLHGLDKILDMDFRLECRDPNGATAIEREYFSIRRIALQISIMIEAWSPLESSLRPPCFFCPRSARKNRAEVPNPELPSVPDRLYVCQSHAPGAPGWRRAKRLVRWAGSVRELGAKYNDQMRRIRQEAQQVISETQMTPEDMGLGIMSEQDWARHACDEAARYAESGAERERDLVDNQDYGPPNDFLVYAKSRLFVEEEYRRQTQVARTNNARRVGKRGGRPRAYSPSQAKMVHAMRAKGFSQVKIAAQTGLSQSTVSRLLKNTGQWQPTQAR